MDNNFLENKFDLNLIINSERYEIEQIRRSMVRKKSKNIMRYGSAEKEIEINQI